MNADQLAARLDCARELAQSAGRLALPYFHHQRELAAERKGPQDWVSAADRAVEALIRDALARAFPGDSMLGEEGGGAVSDQVWVVDPIDGTINFVHGMRYWCISIAFVADGVREIGVIFDPCGGELFWARRGEGAFVGDVPLRASTCTSLDRALVAAGYVPRHPLAEHLATRTALFAAGAAVKDMGAGALMLAHVAAGRFDAFIEPHMHPWDALAGLALVEAAGGVVAPYPGPRGIAGGGRVLAAAPGVYDALAALQDRVQGAVQNTTPSTIQP